MGSTTATPGGGPRERDQELAVVRRAVTAAAGGAGGLLVIDGPAGAGKTALLGVVAAAARAPGLDVPSARGAELEHAFPFGVMRRLLDPVLRGTADPADLLGGAAAPAAWLLAGDPAEPGGPQDPFAARPAR